MFLALPESVILGICSHLTSRDVVQLASCCRHLNQEIRHHVFRCLHCSIYLLQNRADPRNRPRRCCRCQGLLCSPCFEADAKWCYDCLGNVHCTSCLEADSILSSSVCNECAATRYFGPCCMELSLTSSKCPGCFSILCPVCINYVSCSSQGHVRRLNFCRICMWTMLFPCPICTRNVCHFCPRVDCTWCGRTLCSGCCRDGCCLECMPGLGWADNGS